MSFMRFFGRGKKLQEKAPTPPHTSTEQKGKGGPSVHKGLGYMYLVIGLQILLAFGLIGVMMFIGKVITTPWWALLLVFSAGVGGCIYIYYRIKRQVHKIKDIVTNLDRSGKNYEISIMGGALTMRVEQNTNRLLEAPKEQKVIETVPVNNTETSQNVLTVRNGRK